MIVSTRRWLGLGLLAVAALLLLGSVFEGQFLAGSGERRTASPQHLDEPPQPISQPPTVLPTPAPPAPGIMTVLKGVGSALGGLLARFRRKAAEFLSEQRALVCVVGSARTFALPCVHESIYTNVVQSLRSDGSEVDVHVLLSFQDHTKRRDEHRNCTVDASGIFRGMSLLAPLHGLVVPDSSCSSLQRSFDGAACEPTGLQLSWIDKCFQLGRSTDERQYTHYFRIRPDAFFASPIGALRTFEFKAFKNEKNIKSGDSNAIVPFFHDARPNGLLYLHTDGIRHSNAWRAEQFTDELVKCIRTTLRMQLRLKAITDERESGGKEGIYRQYLLAALRGAGIRIQDKKFIQLARQGTQKRERVRKSAALWAQGYVRILLHQDLVNLRGVDEPLPVRVPYNALAVGLDVAIEEDL